jgi:hypothetical protein
MLRRYEVQPMMFGPLRDGQGVRIKKKGKVLYRIIIQGDTEHMEHRVATLDGSLPAGAVVGWDYDLKTRQYTLLGEPGIPQEVIEKINNNYHPIPHKRTWVDNVLDFFDAIATLFRHV